MARAVVSVNGCFYFYVCFRVTFLLLSSSLLFVLVISTWRFISPKDRLHNDPLSVEQAGHGM